MGNVILKGHISYAAKRKYRWIAEFGKNTCEKCAALDGKEFEEDEILQVIIINMRVTTMKSRHDLIRIAGAR